MRLPEVVKALRELEVVQKRAEAMRRLVFHRDPQYAYESLRELGRLTSALTATVHQLLSAEYERLTNEAAQAEARRVAQREADQ